MYKRDRRSNRLQDYDYSSEGMYFVTICTQERKCIFGDVVGADPCVGPKMVLNSIGEMIQSWWGKLPNRFPNVELDQFMIMPNHIHGIVTIHGRTHGSAPTLGRMIQWFKTMTTNHYIRGVKQNQWPPFPGRLWQRGYYEHITRNEEELFEIRQYIQENPIKWESDPENINKFVGTNLFVRLFKDKGQTRRSAPTERV